MNKDGRTNQYSFALQHLRKSDQACFYKFSMSISPRHSARLILADISKSAAGGFGSSHGQSKHGKIDWCQSFFFGGLEILAAVFFLFLDLVYTLRNLLFFGNESLMGNQKSFLSSVRRELGQISNRQRRGAS